MFLAIYANTFLAEQSVKFNDLVQEERQVSEDYKKIFQKQEEELEYPCCLCSPFKYCKTSQMQEKLLAIIKNIDKYKPAKELKEVMEGVKEQILEAYLSRLESTLLLHSTVIVDYGDKVSKYDGLALPAERRDYYEQLFEFLKHKTKLQLSQMRVLWECVVGVLDVFFDHTSVSQILKGLEHSAAKERSLSKLEEGHIWYSLRQQKAYQSMLLRLAHIKNALFWLPKTLSFVLYETKQNILYQHFKKQYDKISKFNNDGGRENLVEELAFPVITYSIDWQRYNGREYMTVPNEEYLRMEAALTAYDDRGIIESLHCPAK